MSQHVEWIVCHSKPGAATLGACMPAATTTATAAALSIDLGEEAKERALDEARLFDGGRVRSLDEPQDLAAGDERVHLLRHPQRRKPIAAAADDEGGDGHGGEQVAC